MATYISLLRGINVSGQKSIKMDDLKRLYEQLHFQHVKTYIQSGNVIFSTAETNRNKLAGFIQKTIIDEYGFVVPVIVLTVETLKTIVQNNPFVKDKQKSIDFMHVTFLADMPGQFDGEAIKLRKDANEEIVVTNSAVYLYCPNGYGRTKLNNNFLESKLKVMATTRNWKITNDLLAIATK